MNQALFKISDFARVTEVRFTSDAEHFPRLIEEGWVELGVMLIPPELAILIPEVTRPYIGFVLVLGRLDAHPRQPQTSEFLYEPRPWHINEKLAEGWTLVGISTNTTTALTAGRGVVFVSYMAVQR